MTAATTATAHQAWDDAWQCEEGRADWLVPEPEVLDLAARLRQGGARRALDLGCGVGRHALAFTRLGYEVVAVDASPSGLVELRRVAEREGLAIDTHEAAMTELPVPDAGFDFVLSWNVIYHGDGAVVRQTIAEIGRVLRPGGHYQGTMLSLRNRHCGAGQEIAPNTWVDRDGEGDKAHPHFFCDAQTLCGLFGGLEVLKLSQDDQGKPGHWHWHLVLQKPS